MASLFGTKDIVHVKNVIAILVIEPIILRSFAWLREDSAWISRGLVFETGIADSVGRWEMARECL